MSSANLVILMGNLTRDPQLSYTTSQVAVVEFGMAINRKFKGSDGQQRDETTFVDLQMFGKRAETINQYCKKGQQLYVEGRLKYESWQAQDGAKRNRLRVLVENFQFLGNGQQQRQQNNAGGQQPQQQPQQQYNEYGTDVDPDDIPF